MNWYLEMSDKEFNYLSECSYEIVKGLPKKEVDDVLIIKIDELIKACKDYCDGWTTLQMLEFKGFTYKHMIWLCIDYVREGDECFLLHFDDWSKALALETEYSKL